MSEIRYAVKALSPSAFHVPTRSVTKELSVPKREFTVANEYHYNRSGPVAWVISHLLRYKLFVASWLIAAIAAWFMAGNIPVLTGRAFTVITSANPDAGQLGAIALLVLGAVLAQGSLDMVARLSAELLAQRIQRDSRAELYLNLLGKSQTFHNRQQVGDIMARANNDVRMLDFMMSPGFDLIHSAA
jgi:ATP-binding cassette, subfamily B, bacterial